MIHFDNKHTTYGFLCPSFERPITIDRRKWVSVAALHYGLRLGYNTDWAEVVRFEKTSIEAKKKYEEIRDKKANHPVAVGSQQDIQVLCYACDALLKTSPDLRDALLRSAGEDLVYKNESPLWGRSNTNPNGMNVVGRIWVGLRSMEQQSNG